LQLSSTLFGDDSPHPNPSKKHRDKQPDIRYYKMSFEEISWVYMYI